MLVSFAMAFDVGCRSGPLGHRFRPGRGPAGQLDDHRNGGIDIKRLGDDAVHTGMAGQLLLLHEHPCGQSHHWQTRQRRVAPDLARGVVAIENGHLHVHQYQLDLAGVSRQPIQRLFAVFGEQHFAFLHSRCAVPLRG